MKKNQCKCHGSQHQLPRREWLRPSGLGFGSLALGYLLNDQILAPGAVFGSEEPAQKTYGDLRPRPGHFPGQAKAVIQLMQNGGPSQMDLFDPKPELSRRNGQKHGEKLEVLQGGSAENILMGSPYKFEKRGQCGMDISELLPH